LAKMCDEGLPMAFCFICRLFMNVCFCWFTNQTKLVREGDERV
jgi:hypothetical protein